MKKSVLIITDGIGKKPRSSANAFLNAHTPTYDKLFQTAPNSLISTYGTDVGLPSGQMGNSEVGHMTIGSGRVIYQDLVKINKAIEEDSLKDNKVLQNLIKTSQRVHIFGLLSDGGVHSHLNHIIALAKIAQKTKEVFIHIATDGRDVLPKSAKGFIEKLEQNGLKVSSLSGRFFSMDRDNRWERLQEAYNAIMFGANPQENVCDYIEKAYKNGVTDEFLPPASFDYSGVKDGDGFIMANFRSDRSRQISALLGDKNFLPIDVAKKSVQLITMTNYSKDFNFGVIFDKEKIKNTLAEVISNAGLSQLHTAETEKYAHVTFFLNGGIEEPFRGEKRVLVASPKVKTYDLAPQMSAFEVKDAVIKGIETGVDFVVVNFANGDMVGHTGNYEAALKAVETVDTCIGEILKSCEKHNYSALITSDHGNCEEMKDENGNMLTNHTVGDVYCFVVDKDVKNLQNGALDNIAPTVLKLMGLEIPKEMSKDLL